MKQILTMPLNDNLRNRLFEFMNKDRISHFYNIYDLTYQPERTKCWVAIANNRLRGYMTEYAERIVTTRGARDCILPLLKNTDLTTPLFSMEPKHLPAVTSVFKPVEPPDQMTIGKISTFLIMKTTPDTATPIIKHRVQELTQKDAEAFASLLNCDTQRALDLLRGIGYGIFKNNKLIASATSPENLEDLAIIRGVHTATEERNRGYATSVCSALVQQLHKQGKTVMLYVSKDNPPAIKVYTKIGFKHTGHTFLSFLAKHKTLTENGFEKLQTFQSRNKYHLSGKNNAEIEIK